MIDTPRRIIIGISGASGIIYGVRLLELLKPTDIETHLVVSKAAEQTRAMEIDLSSSDLKSLADHQHHIADIGAAISSGSFKTMGMIIAPCSMRSLAECATGMTSTLLTRAADVTLKEKRRLALMVRETPLHAGHLEHMLKLANLGADIVPPVPAFYNRPKNIDDLVNHTVTRVLDLFDLDLNTTQRWAGMKSANPLG